MSSDSEEATQSVNAKLDGMVQDAEELCAFMKRKHDSETRAAAVSVGAVAWLAALFGLAVVSSATSSPIFFGNPVGFFIAVSAIAVACAVSTYALRRRRRFPFAELNALVVKMKEGKASPEDGLRLVDSMHEAMLALKKGKVDDAFWYGAVAFVLVGLFGKNVAVGLLAGVIVYLYFRHEALGEYENESRRYEESKRDFAQSL
jgi:hypothetical protein